MKKVLKAALALLATITVLVGIFQSVALAEVQPLNVTVAIPAVESVNAATAAELEAALADKAPSIKLTADFAVDRTFFVPYDVVIFCEQAVTLTRAADFAGDIFVIGEDKDAIAAKKQVTLSVGGTTTAAVLTIDGNKQNLTVDVAGTVFFVCSMGKAELYENLVVTNHKKTANDRTAVAAHGLSYPDRVGGAIAIVAEDGFLNVMGGTYSNSEVNLPEDATVSFWGGAFYNFGTMNVYGGTISGNKGMRGGAIYNYRRLHIYNATLSDNTATTLGGALYCPASTGSFSYLGEPNAQVTAKVLFTENEAGTHGGAICCQSNMEVYNTTFSKNVAQKSGGAFYASNEGNIKVKDSDFQGNEAGTHGGAFNLTSGVTMEANHVTATANTATENGGVANVTGGAKLLINDLTATKNTATGFGGVLFSEGGDTVIYDSTLVENGANNGGALYFISDTAEELYSTARMYNTQFNKNTASGNGGAVFIYTYGGEVLMHSCTLTENTAGNFGGALQISGESVVKLYNITAKNNAAASGGFMYETKAKTVVDLIGVTVKGNTATTSGPIIHGNTTNAKLNLNKALYVDEDHTGEYDDAYFKTAIAYKLTVNYVDTAVPTYEKYGQKDNTAVVEGTLIRLQAGKGYQLKAGSLVVTDAYKNKFVPTRVGYREGGNAAQYEIPAEAVAPFTVSYTFIQPGEESGYNVGFLGTSVHTEEKALRFVHRLHVDNEQKMLYNGAKVAVKEYGLLLASAQILPDAADLDIETANDSMHVHQFAWPTSGKFYDKCDEYVDIAVQVKGIPAWAEDMQLHTRVYFILEDDTVVYMAPATACYTNG